MSTLVTIIHVICCLFLMLTVLLQSGKGGGMGAAFGGGNAATVFGGSGASSFLKKLTAIAATIFMLTSMTLAYFSSDDAGDALQDFGQRQQTLFKQKEDARKKALQEAAEANELTPDPATDPLAPAPVMNDGDVGADDHGATPAEVPAEVPEAGSAAAPAATTPAPKPAATTPAPKPAATTPAPKPAAPTPAPKPAAPAPSGSGAP